MDLMGIGEFARRSLLSPKALRLYDELGLLSPARVDRGTGYRWYAATQLAAASRIAALRQLGVPLAQIKVVISLPPAEAARQLTAYWSQAEAEHAIRRALAGHLVDQLTGKRSVMYEVALRQVPERNLLCLLRHVENDTAAVALGKEFVGIVRDPRMTRSAGAARSAFAIYHGEVSEDSDGPVEWCLPVPAARAAELAVSFPALTLRTEPAHEEAYVHLGQAEMTPSQWQLASRALFSWVAAQQRQPGDLGVRVTYHASKPITASSRPDCDFALPLS